MNTQEFEQKLTDAFENGLPIVEKVNTLLEKIDSEEEKDFELLYQLCATHYKVAESAENNGAISPIKNTQFWGNSIEWLIDHLYWIDKASMVDNRFHEFSNGMILWWFKWVMGDIDKNPDMSLEDIEEYNQKMDVYFTEIYDLGERSGYLIRAMQAIDTNNREKLEVNLYQWQEASENEFDDCWACQLHDIVRSYCYLKRYDKALSWAKDIIDGSQSCGEVPQISNSLIAEAYFYTGQIDKAKARLELGYPLIKQNPSFIRQMAEFMRLYRIMDMEQKAIEIYQENKHLLEENKNLFEQMLFYIEVSHLDVAEQAQAKQIATELAQRFDKRNGNSYYMDKL